MPISSGWDSWDSHTSDPLADIQRFFKMIENERWICKRCAWTTRYPPYHPNLQGPMKCGGCGACDWYYTTNDDPEL